MWVSIKGNNAKEKSDRDGKAAVKVENSETVKGYDKAMNHQYGHAIEVENSETMKGYDKGMNHCMMTAYT
jgi:hypothetical protein